MSLNKCIKKKGNNVKKGKTKELFKLKFKREQHTIINIEKFFEERTGNLDVIIFENIHNICLNHSVIAPGVELKMHNEHWKSLK